MESLDLPLTISRPIDVLSCAHPYILQTDHVENKVIDRTRRLSLTFRQVASAAECHCPFPLLCDAQGGWGSAEAKLKDEEDAVAAADTAVADAVDATAAAASGCDTAAAAAAT
jgi:hypothetical protein